MRLVFMGTPEFAVPTLRALRRAGHDILAVVTPIDRPRLSRYSPSEPSPVKAEALRQGIPVLQPASVKEAEVADRLRELGPEVIVVVAYGQILTSGVLTIPPRWAINLHASILPRYRGAAPIARAILAGEKVTGVTTMKMDRGLDTGDILLQKECVIGLNETAGELTVRLAELGANLMVETLEQHARGALEPRRQDAREATLAPRMTREEGRIDWTAAAQEIVNRIRGCNPWPVAVARLGQESVKILRAEVSFEPVQGKAGGSPGRVIAAGDGRIIVRCQGDSRLALLELCFPGRKVMSAREVLNGRLLKEGDTFAPAAPR
jgi:methionyl-tRNA formyltransferase